MNIELTILFFKKRYKGLLFCLALFAALYAFDKSKDYMPLLIVFILNYGREYYGFMRIEKLIRATGQTAEQLANTSFLNNWQEIRARGFRRYCLIEGGLAKGAILGIFIGFFSEIAGITNRLPLLNNSFILIVVMYGIGITVGFALHRSYWIGNERRFKQLTQFEHIIS
ncbi:hypothetical protein IDJ77_24635 [Mucilaginibacter sp. ZT4R22]|uniref:Uncharacterized protein n=1 Tax=Mucilaginibacter pankratovii TaxID=2772110 RepID=A0ABR7WXK3_9SPHI|nr:hypothetical protein [Mucilaginibacter pankratovii]MBD1367021.1 hypothetical protein [Mucilaginibacter pankratovii]